MQKAQAQQFQAAMEGFIGSLPKTFTETAWPDDPSVAFVLQEKSPHGTWPDGKRYRERGRISYTQASIIATTSQGQAEMSKRIRMLLLDGVDTTLYRSTPTNAAPDMISMDKVQEIVKLALIEAEKARKGTMPAGTPEQIAQRVVEPARPTRVGIQSKKKKRPEENQEEKTAEVKLWTERAEILGIEPPVLRLNGFVDGRWILRRGEPLWAAHLERTPATEPAPAT